MSVIVGELVQYHRDCDTSREPSTATVMKVSGDTCDLRIVFGPSNIQSILGVFPLGHPRLDNPEIKKNGAWSMHPWRRKIEALESRLAALEAKEAETEETVDEVVDAVTRPKPGKKRDLANV